MVGGKMEILWSPNFEDKFLTFGKDVRLYRVDVAKDRGVTKGQGDWWPDVTRFVTYTI